MRYMVAPGLALGLSVLLVGGFLALLGLPAPLPTLGMLLVGGLAAGALGWRASSLGFFALASLVALIAAALFIFAPSAAFAADSSSVTIPWGDWLASVLGTVAAVSGTIAVAIITWALRLLPASLRSYVDAERRKQAEQLLQHAIDYGINDAKGFVTGKTLDVRVGSDVAAGALQYAVDHGPGWLIDWMGGAERVRDKILSRLPLDDGITATEVADNVALVRPAR